MEIMTRKALAAKVAKEWKEEMCINGTWRTILNSTKTCGDVYKQLVALGKSPDPDDIDKILCSSDWTEIGECAECGKDGFDTMVCVFNDRDIIYLCFKCIDKIHKKLKAKQLL